MPAMHFYVTWPDGSEERCYSPSTVITEFLKPGAAYTVSEFFALSEKALLEASNRVQRKYGFHCSSAMDQLAQIQEKAGFFQDEPDLCVTVTKIIPA
jgi:uncharacterized repeat protein (TIGR04042 family)